jgi:hypothetical protein
LAADVICHRRKEERPYNISAHLASASSFWWELLDRQLPQIVGQNISPAAGGIAEQTAG